MNKKILSRIKEMEAKKKLFWWDFVRTVIFFLLLVTLRQFFLSANASVNVEITGGPKATVTDWVWQFFWIPLTEITGTDGHVWADLIAIFSGSLAERRWVWITMPAIVVIDYLWAFRNNNTAGKLRVSNWVFALLVYFIWTVLDPLLYPYDYFTWLFFIEYWGYAWWVILIAITSLASMWIGAIIVGGYLMYKELSATGHKMASWMPALLSLGIPGIGQIVMGRYRRGLLFFLPIVPVWVIGLFTFYIPTTIWWLYAAYDAKKISGG